MQLPADQAGPSRPANEGEAPDQPDSVFDRLGHLSRDIAGRVPARTGVHIKNAGLLVQECLREGSATTATSRQTEGTEEFSPVEIERLQGILGEVSHDGILDGDFRPLMEYLLATPVPDRLRLPKIRLFDGSGDPSDHLGIYYSWARAYGYFEAIRCRLFDTTLAGEACR